MRNAALSVLGITATPSSTGTPLSYAAGSERALTLSNLANIVSFGDSWTDIRFDVNGTQPSLGIPFGNTGKTSSNGKMWPQYLAMKYNTSTVLGYDLALSGAVVDVDIITTATHDMDEQVNEKFEPYADQSGLLPSRKTLYTLWVGNNDMNRSYNGTDPAINSKVIARYKELATHLHNVGARNFLFLSVPPMWLFPSNMANGADLAKLRSAVEDLNARLQKMAREIDHDLAYTSVYYFDITSLFGTVVEDPGQFNETAIYKDTTSWREAYESGTSKPDYKSSKCTYSALEYLFIDGAHPTQPWHDLMANRLSIMLDNGESLS
ncbi:hypothetical protein PFICI_04940 [Pestalotiopsis fici W106-1]|uniref:SGNH hydrolase-type esterase domain-containing protein n=1 Tax=Pestalotiopsis fici (strain W106-1 / CGMCC3.15140) TaxID=1229662 RepID=W3XAK2_PESFW|nr:uncharacterized protein PFICI_04940 [Pestalotiopsis fici W106-1]ETS83064.1 hypothetical protein PFICI_04940 [Pestalotiopsis fici W106-1]